jgi:hypothetical protein
VFYQEFVKSPLIQALALNTVTHYPVQKEEVVILARFGTEGVRSS